jgi:hypothetical protein
LLFRLHKVHDEDGKPFEVEVTWVCDESNKEHQRVSAALKGCMLLYRLSC